MEQERREQVALYFVLVALVLTGGASSAWRLACIALPLLMFQLRLSVTFGAVFLLLAPSVAELLLHSNLVGSIGGRLSIVASVLIACSAAALGKRLLESRALRQSLAAALPYFAFGLLLQAFLRFFNLVPEPWQYLSGNHLSCLILITWMPTFALRMRPINRLICVFLLLIALVVTGSRWGIWVGSVFGLLMVAVSYGERIRLWSVCALVATLIAPIGLWGLIDTNKAGLLKALSGITALRPWTGLGPGGAEAVSLQFVEQTARLTHIETLIWDWPATYGWPMACSLLVFGLWLVFRRKQDSSSATVRRLEKLAAVGVMGVLCHDLLDFSLFSGAVRVGTAVLVGMLLPVRWGQKPSRRSMVMVGFLTLGSLAGWHHFDPMRMELSDRLDDIPHQFGQPSFRYWLNKSRRELNHQAKIPSLSKALQIAPGCRDCWFDLGEIFLKLGRTNQAAQSFRSGLSVTRPGFVNESVRRIASLPNSLMVSAVGDHLGAARVAAEIRRSPSLDDLDVLLALDDRLRDASLRQEIYRAIRSSQLSRVAIVPALWTLAQRPILVSNESVELIRLFEKFDPQLDVQKLLVRLIRVNKQHCFGLAVWNERNRLKLVPIIEELQSRCGTVLIGNGLILELLHDVQSMVDP